MRNMQRSVWDSLSVSSNIFFALAATLAFSFLVNLMVLTSPLYMLQVYDRVLGSGQLETLVFLSIIALAALAVYGALDAVRSFILTRLGTYIDVSLREPVLFNALSENGSTGRRQIEDLNTIRNFLSSQGPVPFLDSPWVPFFIVIMALLHPWLGVLGLVSVIALFCLALANDRLTRQALLEANQQQGAASEFAGAAVTNAEVVRAMGMKQVISRRYRTHVDGMIGKTSRAGDIGSALSSLSKALRMVVQSAALGLGAYLVLKAEMSPGGMIAGSILLGRALAPVEQTIGAWRNVVSARDAYKRISETLKATPVTADGLTLPEVKGHVGVEGVFYQLPGTEKPILRGINFAIEPGTTLALVGPSASGKSTLCRLIVGAVQPVRGAVRIDGASIDQLSDETIQKSIGYLPQTIELFAGTVRENIARLGDVDDAAVIAAAKAAGCHDMILHLAQGYATELGPRGMFLSGGQRQRIGLARALYGKPRLLVLDEPNSSLDQDGERALVEAMVAAKAEGTTVIVVSHRTSLFGTVDKLGILRDGVLERFGDRDEILRELQPARPTLVPVGDQPPNAANGRVQP